MIKNFINGQWVASTATDKVDIVNPANREILDHTPLGNSADVDAAVQSAQAAYPAWRQTPVIDRVQPLFRLKTLMEAAADDLARQITLEHGKTLAEAMGSVRRGIQMVETACGMPTMMMGDILEDIAPGIDSQSVRRPMGVFAAIAPFNFPAMVPMWFWPFGIAAGNTFVVKPSERVPLTQMRIFELMQQAGLPDGVLNMVHGGKETVDSLCTHPDIKGISFVGSTPVAKHVYVTSATAGKRVQSLGGAKNYMVVMPDAVMDKAADTALESIIGCAGERCMAGSVIISVGEDSKREIAERITARARAIRIGDGQLPNTDMGPVISQESKDRIKGMIQRALDEGAELLVDGRDGVDELPGYFLKPTVLGNITPEMEIAREEVFGPVVMLAETPSLDAAIEWVNSSPYGNTTTLFTTSGAAARHFCYEVEPAMLGVNIGVPAPMAFFSFGGSKQSFFGDIRAHGKASVDFYTQSVVTIHRWIKDSSIW